MNDQIVIASEQYMNHMYRKVEHIGETEHHDAQNKTVLNKQRDIALSLAVAKHYIVKHIRNRVISRTFLYETNPETGLIDNILSGTETDVLETILNPIVFGIILYFNLKFNF